MINGDNIDKFNQYTHTFNLWNYVLLMVLKLQIKTNLSSNKKIETKDKKITKMNLEQNNDYLKSNINHVVFVNRL